MGAALARTLAKNGLRVAAWNRTHPKAEALADSGVVPLRSIDEAVQGANLVLACTMSPAHTREVLAEVTDWEATTVMYVGSGTPDSAVELEAWLGERGAGYLDGVITSYPDEIGTPEGMIVVAGAPHLWSRYADTVCLLGGRSSHVSDDVRGANILASSFSGAFYVAALAAYVEGAAFAHGHGLSLDAIRAVTLQHVDLLRTRTIEVAEAIASGNHETDQASVATFLDGAETTLNSLSSAGYSAKLIGAARENLQAAFDRGLADRAFSAQFEVLKP
jgi:3-hydroxyisobutyrate dehydrogenase-like beta-hydroxyacid dehydrogenase